MKTLTENLSIMEQNQTHDMPDFLKKYDKEMELYMQAGLRKKADLVKEEKQIRFIAWQAEQYGMKLIKAVNLDSAVHITAL